MNQSRSRHSKKTSARKFPVKFTLVSGGVGAALCGASQIISDFGDWKQFAAYAFLGLMLGFMAAPEFARKRFVFPELWQAGCGGVCGFAFGLARGFDAGVIGLCALVGFLIGATAKLWLKHAPLP